MKIPYLIKTGALMSVSFASGFVFALLHMLIAALKVVWWGGIGYLGFVIFRSSNAWYWSVFGVVLMINGIGAILPAVDLIWTALVTLIMPFIYAVSAFKDYREHREFSKDLSDLMSIALDFLPRKTYDDFGIRETGKTIQDMYNHYFSILLWLWTENLKSSNKNFQSFIQLSRDRFPAATGIYDDLISDIELDFFKVDIEEVLTLSYPGKRDDFIRHLTYATHWTAKRLVGEGENEIALAKEFAGHVVEFMKANDL